MSKFGLEGGGIRHKSIPKLLFQNLEINKVRLIHLKDHLKYIKHFPKTLFRVIRNKYIPSHHRQASTEDFYPFDLIGIH